MQFGENVIKLVSRKKHSSLEIIGAMFVTFIYFIFQLEEKSKEELIKIVKKQLGFLQKAKSRTEGKYITNIIYNRIY